MGGEKELNQAADIFADEPEAEAPDFGAEERPSGVFKKGKARGPAPRFGAGAGKGSKHGHRDDPTARTQPLPEWLERSWAGDTSMLPKRPPGAK